MMKTSSERSKPRTSSTHEYIAFYPIETQIIFFNIQVACTLLQNRHHRPGQVHTKDNKRYQLRDKKQSANDLIELHLQIPQVQIAGGRKGHPVRLMLDCK